jgi:hypothetical protein
VGLALAGLAVLAASVVGLVAPARAQNVPDSDLSSYVLFGFEEVDFKGGQGNHGPSIIDGGNIGANGRGFIRGNDARVNVCANAQMVMSDGTMVVGDTMRLGDAGTPTLECDVDEAFYNTPVGNPETPRSGPALPFTPPVVKAAPPFPDFACDAGNPLTVTSGSSVSVPPGTYGDVVFQNGTTITLEPGVYTVCDLTTGQNVTVIAPPGVVFQSERRFLLNDGAVFDGSDCATIPVVYARADGVGANDNAVRFGQDSTVWGHFYTPGGRLNLGNQTDLHGTFWARAIGSDFNVDVEFCEPPLPTPATGTIMLTKQVSGAVAGAPPDATYDVHYDCTLPGPGLRDALDGVVGIRAGQTLTFTDVQVGTTCTATEIEQPPALPGYAFDPPIITPASTVTVTEEGEVVEVVVENPLREVLGALEVTKTISGDTAGYEPDSVFGFALDCVDDAFDTTFELTAGETFTSDPIRVGVACTVSETAQPEPMPGFIYRAPVFTPDPPTVTIAEEGQVVSVDVDNPIAELAGELVGEIRVHKTVTGDTAGYVAGTRFRFALDCDDDAFDTTFTLAADDTFSSGPVAVGATCTVAELAAPQPAAGFAYTAPVFTPDPPTVTLSRPGEVAVVQVDNALVGPPAPIPAPPPTPAPPPAPVTGPGDPGGDPGAGAAAPADLSVTGGPWLLWAVAGAAALIAGVGLSVVSARLGRRPGPATRHP